MYLGCVTALLMHGDPCVTVTEPYISPCAYSSRSAEQNSRPVLNEYFVRRNSGFYSAERSPAEQLDSDRASALGQTVCMLGRAAVLGQVFQLGRKVCQG